MPAACNKGFFKRIYPFATIPVSAKKRLTEATCSGFLRPEQECDLLRKAVSYFSKNPEESAVLLARTANSR